MITEAYMNWGRWVADCPQRFCHSAEQLNIYQIAFHCSDSDCRQLANIRWPLDAQEIWDALQERPERKTRNWLPKNHELAIASGVPHGQTVQELREETAEFMSEEFESK